MALRCDAGAEAALRVCVPLRGGNAEAGLRVRDAGAEAALRVRVPLHGNVVAEAGLCVRGERDGVALVGSGTGQVRV